MLDWLAYAAALAVKSTAVLALAWLLTLAMRRRSAAARHAVWTAAFSAVLLLPALGVILPALQAPGLRRVLPSPTDPIFRVNAFATADPSPAARPVRALSPAAPLSLPVRPDWRLLALPIWALGALLMLVRSAVASLRMMRATRSAPACSFAASSTHARLLEGAQGSMPMAFGVLRPVVFLPADARDWDDERREMVLRHEFAHIERGDLATQHIARAALSLVWWNPLAWHAWSEFLKERETAADDLVLSAGVKASAYASHLLEIARERTWNSFDGLAAVAMARPAQLEGRLMAILDGKTNHGAPRRVALTLAAIVAAALTLPMAALQAQDPASAIPADVEATIRAAFSQKNHEILDATADGLIKAKQYDAARKMEDAALEVRQSQAGAGSPSYALGLLKIGDLEMSRRNAAEAMKFYERAAAIGGKPEIYRANMSMGGEAIRQKDGPAADRYFDRAAANAPTPDLQTRALLLQAQGDMLDANLSTQVASRYLAAIANSSSDSGQHIAARNLYARYLDSQGRTDEAKSMNDQTAEELKAFNDRLKSGIPAPPAAGYTASAQEPVMKAGNGVTQPVPVAHPEPLYTEDARAAKYQGTVLLYIEVASDGRVQNERVVRPLGMGLDENALAAVSQWIFKPGTLNGKPVTVAAQVEVNFKLL